MSYPVQRASTVHQYAADYVELQLEGDLAIEFSGQTQARLMPVDAHSGRYAWWSNRGDDSDTTLTRAFDLRAVDRATLEVWMWYDIEAGLGLCLRGGLGGWRADVGYLGRVLVDDRQSQWQQLWGGLHGRSGGWIQETFDLDAYAGSEVLVRFEYVTDDAVNRAGWLIDDVCVPEMGVCDDFESGPGDWVSEGFVYSDNRVAQRYLVQVILFDGRAPERPASVRHDARSADASGRGRSGAGSRCAA